MDNIEHKLNSQRNTVKLNWIFTATIIVVFIFGFFTWNRDRDALQKNYKVTLGKIYDFETSSKSTDIFVKYNFQTENNKHQNHSSLQCPKADCLQFAFQLLNGKTLCVVYEKSNPTNNKNAF